MSNSDLLFAKMFRSELLEALFPKQRTFNRVTRGEWNDPEVRNHLTDPSCPFSYRCGD